MVGALRVTNFADALARWRHAFGMIVPGSSRLVEDFRRDERSALTADTQIGPFLLYGVISFNSSQELDRQVQIRSAPGFCDRLSRANTDLDEPWKAPDPKKKRMEVTTRKPAQSFRSFWTRLKKS